ncbi:hypothetical protein DFH07DRAFT_967633 [Mycena maculata]|uniref:DNA 3'-5' helicase n=1 Tax=Mycena maculata TaxID=230809 RepID=A0AAD7I5L8_9AGAR|nr:hypothetical protein DFH07DRAFT_967633 [Mycena maculata]
MNSRPKLYRPSNNGSAMPTEPEDDPFSVRPSKLPAYFRNTRAPSPTSSHRSRGSTPSAYSSRQSRHSTPSLSSGSSGRSSHSTSSFPELSPLTERTQRRSHPYPVEKRPARIHIASENDADSDLASCNPPPARPSKLPASFRNTRAPSPTSSYQSRGSIPSAYSSRQSRHSTPSLSSGSSNRSSHSTSSFPELSPLTERTQRRSHPYPVEKRPARIHIASQNDTDSDLASCHFSPPPYTPQRNMPAPSIAFSEPVHLKSRRYNPPSPAHSAPPPHRSPDRHIHHPVPHFREQGHERPHQHSASDPQSSSGFARGLGERSPDRHSQAGGGARSNPPPSTAGSTQAGPGRGQDGDDGDADDGHGDHGNADDGHGDDGDGEPDYGGVGPAYDKAWDHPRLQPKGKDQNARHYALSNIFHGVLFPYFVHKCSPCAVRGLPHDHPLDACPHGTGCSDSDAAYRTWHNKCFSFTINRWCSHCLVALPSGGGWHPDGFGPLCPYRQILKPALWALFTNHNPAPHITTSDLVPEELFNTEPGLYDLCQWAQTPVAAHPGILNLHVLILWVMDFHGIIDIPDKSSRVKQRRYAPKENVKHAQKTLSPPTMDDGDTICPKCKVSCPISLGVHDQEHHIDEQAVKFKDGHTYILERHGADKFFRCPRCQHPERRSRTIQFHCAECLAPADVPMPPAGPPDNPTPAPPPPAVEDEEMDPPDAPPTAYNDPTVLYPSADTMTTHATYALANYSVVINLYHRLLICLCCNNALSPSSAYQHLCAAHETLTKPPPGMIPALTEEHALRDPVTIPHPTNRPPPAFGLRVSTKPYIECGQCGHAYASPRGITSHACTGDLNPPRDNITGYAQQFCTGARNSWFLVDMEQRTRAPEIDFSALASRLDLGIPDYTSEHVSPTSAEAKKDIFISREGWDEMMTKVPPKEARELTRLSTSDDSDLHKLGPRVVAYVTRLQPQLCKYSTYGQQRELADYGVQQVFSTSCPYPPNCACRTHSLNTFNSITLESCQRYGRTLWSLVFNLLRQVDQSATYKPRHLYPITPEQLAALLDLLRALRRLDNDDIPSEDYSDTQQEMDDDADIELLDHDEDSPESTRQPTRDELHSSALDDAIQRVPVLLFLVLSSIKADGGLILANSITQRIAHFTYCGRGSLMLEIERSLAANPDWNFHKAHGLLKKYHTNGYVTPLVAIFQLFTLLKVIAQTEIAPSHGRWADVERQVVDWNGTLIRREILRRPYDALIQDIETIYHRDVFFGKPVPPDLCADFFRDRNIADPATNRAIGFCALDHPPNGFRQLAHDYLRWLLSHPDLRLKFTYYADGEIHWRPTPVKRLMDALDLLGLKIALAHQISAPCLSRAKEVADMSLRNTIGSTTRNFQIILNTLTLVSMLDKTSHKRLNYRLIPSASTTLLSRYHLQLLVFLRPAQVFFARRFFGIEAANRFHTALWPRIHGTLTGDILSKHLAQVTYKHLGVHLRITPFRKFVTFWLKEHVSPALQNTHPLIDQMASHSEGTALRHYNQDAGLTAGVSANDVHLMLLICRDWQKFIGVDRHEPLALSLHGEKIDEQGPLADHYRALVNHYDVANTDPPSGTTGNELRANVDEIRNELVTAVASSIREEMILQQAILHPTLPPIHSFHELRDVSNVEVHPHRRAQLRQLTGNPKADFVCVPQAIFFEKLATNKTNLFAILRCGLGKTWLTLAALPILAPGQQLIWLIPTSGLQADTVLTATNLGLKVARYKPGEAFDTEADVVWAPIEITAQEGFQTWAKQRVNAGRVWWIVLDEIHKFLTDVGYRPIFRNLITLARFGARFLGLSGTTPPPLLPVLFGLSGITTWDVLRMPIGRSNLAMVAKRHKTHAEARAALVADVHKALATLGDNDRIMIFCRKRDMATDMAAVFNTEAYLAPGQNDTAQAELNAKLLPAWRQGLNLHNEPCKVIASTSILGTGLNYAHVRYVWMLERPATLFDYQQQVERGGRDNEYAESTLHTSEEDSKRIPTSPTDITLGVRELDDLATNQSICLRSIPSAYFDGVLTTCMTTAKTTNEPTVFCGNCRRLSTKTPPSDPVPISTIDTRLVIGQQDPLQRLLPLDINPREQNKSAVSSMTNMIARAAPLPTKRRALPAPTSQATNAEPLYVSLSLSQHLAHEPTGPACPLRPHHSVPALTHNACYLSHTPCLRKTRPDRHRPLASHSLLLDLRRRRLVTVRMRKTRHDRHRPLASHSLLLDLRRRRLVTVRMRKTRHDRHRPLASHSLLLDLCRRRLVTVRMRNTRHDRHRPLVSHSLLLGLRRRRLVTPLAAPRAAPPPSRPHSQTLMVPANASAPQHKPTQPIASRPPAFLRTTQLRRPALATHNDLIVQRGESILPRIRAQGNVWPTRRDVLARVWAPAVDTIRAKCPFCWALGQLDDVHAVEDCTVLVLDENDKIWKQWAKLDGICWNCSVPHRNDGWHPDGKPEDCRDAHILLPAVCAYITHPPPDIPLTAATFLPSTIFPNGTLDTRAFSQWAHMRVPDHGPMLNLHKLSLWLLARRNTLALPPELRSVFPIASIP